MKAWPALTPASSRTLARRHAGLGVEFGGSLRRRWQHRTVGRTGEHVDPVVGEVGQRSIAPDRGQAAGLRRTGRRVGFTMAGPHAALQRQLDPAPRRSHRVRRRRCRPRRAAREGDVELTRHVRAGRQPRDRRPGQVDVSAGSGSAANACCAAQSSAVPASKELQRLAIMPRLLLWVHRSIAARGGMACANAHNLSRGTTERNTAREQHPRTSR